MCSFDPGNDSNAQAFTSLAGISYPVGSSRTTPAVPARSRRPGRDIRVWTAGARVLPRRGPE